ncbi:MAG: hypothetical protein JST00_15970 [Deltaproteobacteria bacterium]|nr:hypothetical protein [Deltaproteobacteria bacterium]
MNPRLASHASSRVVDGHDGESPQAPTEQDRHTTHERHTAQRDVVHEGKGVAMPTYRERHPHRGAERVSLGEPVARDVKTDEVAITDPSGGDAAPPPPAEHGEGGGEG